MDEKIAYLQIENLSQTLRDDSSLMTILEKVGGPSKEGPSSLSLAKLFSRLRTADPSIWQSMIMELMQRKGHSLASLAFALNVSQRTIKRLADQVTRRPNLRTCYNLFFLHLRECLERYRYQYGELSLMDWEF